jgi:hypothetical protein
MWRDAAISRISGLKKVGCIRQFLDRYVRKLASDHFYGVPHQRSVFHKIQHIADHLLYGDLEVDGTARDDQAQRKANTARKKAIFADAGAMYAQETEGEIRTILAGYSSDERPLWCRHSLQPASSFTPASKTCADFRSAFFPLVLSLRD